jgi:hypothetical protein
MQPIPDEVMMGENLLPGESYTFILHLGRE